MTLGNQRVLQEDDLYRVLPEDKSELLGLNLEKYNNLKLKLSTT